MQTLSITTNSIADLIRDLEQSKTEQQESSDAYHESLLENARLRSAIEPLQTLRTSVAERIAKIHAEAVAARKDYGHAMNKAKPNTGELYRFASKLDTFLFDLGLIRKDLAHDPQTVATDVPAKVWSRTDQERLLRRFFELQEAPNANDAYINDIIRDISKYRDFAFDTDDSRIEAEKLLDGLCAEFSCSRDQLADAFHDLFSGRASKAWADDFCEQLEEEQDQRAHEFARPAAPKPIAVKRAVPKSKPKPKKKIPAKKRAPHRSTVSAQLSRKLPKKAGTKPAVSKKSPKLQRKPNPAFMAPKQPDELLAAIVGSKPIPQTEITKKVWAYVKKNHLQDPADWRMINCDDPFRALCGTDTVGMFELNKIVQKHIQPA